MPIAFTGFDIDNVTDVYLTLLELGCHHAGAEQRDGGSDLLLTDVQFLGNA